MDIMVLIMAQEEQSKFVREVAGYITLFRSRDNFKRVCTAWLVMFWQQWTGIDSSRSSSSKGLGGMQLLTEAQSFIMRPAYFKATAFLRGRLLSWPRASLAPSSWPAQFLQWYVRQALECKASQQHTDTFLVPH